MALAYLGRDISEQKASEALRSYPFDAPASNVQLLTSLGYDAIYTQTTLEELRTFLQAEIPVIIFLHTGQLPYWDENVSHAVVLVGATNEVVYLHDPDFDASPQTAPIEDFLLAWGESDHYCAVIRS